MKALFTGHRSLTSELECRRIVNQLIDAALERDVVHFYCGMARGTDLIAGEELVKRRLKWTAAVPCEGQTFGWNKRDKNRHTELLKQCNRKVVLYPHYEEGVMQARNLWMVRRSDICLAYYNGISLFGGTYLTTEMALENNLTVIYGYYKQPLKVIEGSKQLELNLF